MYSAFRFEVSWRTMEDLLAEIRSMGLQVVRTKVVGGPTYPEERGYRIVDTDITISDPVVFENFGSIPVIGVFCPSRTMYLAGFAGATHDPDVNKKVYGRLKRKFARKGL